MTQKNLEILNENLENTNWQNARYKNGKLVADYYGTIQYPIGGGRYNVYTGTTTCRIDPRTKLFETVFNYGFDQGGFIAQNMDYSI